MATRGYIHVYHLSFDVWGFRKVQAGFIFIIWFFFGKLYRRTFGCVVISLLTSLSLVRKHRSCVGAFSVIGLLKFSLFFLFVVGDLCVARIGSQGCRSGQIGLACCVVGATSISRDIRSWDIIMEFSVFVLCV